MDKQPVSSNLQGLENDKPIPRGEPNETINFDCNRQIVTPEHQPTGEIIREKSDIYRLQDEDFHSRVNDIESGQHHITDNSKNHQTQNKVSEYGPVVHPDSKLGRLHLSIRYNDEQNQLIIQIIDAQGIIRPEQKYAPEMKLIFSLIGTDHIQSNTEKHERIVVQNAAIQWKEPMIFSSMTYEKVIEHNLYILITNDTDPSAPRDREVLIPLNNLKRHTEEINQWFNLQFVTST